MAAAAVGLRASYFSRGSAFHSRPARASASVSRPASLSVTARWAFRAAGDGSAAHVAGGGEGITHASSFFVGEGLTLVGRSAGEDGEVKVVLGVPTGDLAWTRAPRAALRGGKGGHAVPPAMRATCCCAFALCLVCVDASDAAVVIGGTAHAQAIVRGAGTVEDILNPKPSRDSPSPRRPAVSGSHAQIDNQGADLFVVDLDSTNSEP